MSGHERQTTGFRATLDEARGEGRFLVETLDTGLDVARIREDYQRALGLCALRETPRRDGSTLRSFSLTHRPRAKDPLHDGNNTQYAPDNSRLFEEADFTEFNPAFEDTIFYEIYRSMPFSVGRMRLNFLPERTVFPMHRDSATRAHIALKTNENCFLMSGDAQAHHVPTDGNTYIFDTKLPHTALNASREDRIHLTMAVAHDD
jgi:hypothetical protein